MHADSSGNDLLYGNFPAEWKMSGIKDLVVVYGFKTLIHVYIAVSLAHVQVHFFTAGDLGLTQGNPKRVTVYGWIWHPVFLGKEVGKLLFGE